MAQPFVEPAFNLVVWEAKTTRPRAAVSLEILDCEIAAWRSAADMEGLMGSYAPKDASGMLRESTLMGAFLTYDMS